jgi:hypothetical protein
MISQQDAGTAVAMSYENPEDNTFFCGQTYGSITGQCLTSKPCPSGDHSSCPSTEGCYIVPSCTNEYSDNVELTAAINSIDAQATLVSVCGSDYSDAADNFCTNQACPNGDVSYIYISLALYFSVISFFS